MSKQPLRISNSRSNQVIRQVGWRALGVFVLLMLLILLSWIYTQNIAQSPAWWDIFGLAGIHALISFTLERALVSLPLKQVWRYRIALLGSVGVFIIHWVIIQFSPSQSLDIGWIIDISIHQSRNDVIP